MPRTRIVCVSDTHNCAASIKLPPGDVLVHAGDLTNQGSRSEKRIICSTSPLLPWPQLSRAVSWLEAADFEAKIVIAGNHDITLDSAFYAEHGHVFHNQRPESPTVCRELFTSSPSLTYLAHESATIRLPSRGVEFSVFGSPYSPRRGGLWAFGYDEDSSPWDAIPSGTDIVVTHTPPRTHCDMEDGGGQPAGCEALRRALYRVRPRLAVCGHIHDGRGVEHVSWEGEKEGDEASSSSSFTRRTWNDPGAGNKKLSLVHLDGMGETCIVNAAMMKSRRPHVGGKQFHKPIVVDVDLPPWRREGGVSDDEPRHEAAR
ncbi:hypothetical protein L249_1171 [Ophiocordyceps polyrhachis-furcata BCC 54312]|uniref:Calcineurin-like phosphoesterase domain-containing protein n=1 Tax=Ophiocordyceps polyrhachis-furcata BCC 54312 TaxID=1330021 RepID=A0A367LFN9_9HYPO|nr:hypothetical protein L249_1171 [Ophiocordyceps polyrhachis-furcata BCC 54312]